MIKLLKLQIVIEQRDVVVLLDYLFYILFHFICRYTSIYTRGLLFNSFRFIYK